MISSIRIYFILLFFFCANTLNAQIPSDLYKRIIASKKSDTEIDKYWNEILRIDQTVLLKESNSSKYDSLSIDNLIKAALMLENHGALRFSDNQIPVPIVNYSHCNFGKANLILWEFMKELNDHEGVYQNYGSNFEAWGLDFIAFNFYGYSVLDQDSLHRKLASQLDDFKSTSTVDDLNSVFEDSKKIRSLKTKKTLGTWKWSSETPTNSEQKSTVICLKSDNNYYLEFDKSSCPIRLNAKQVSENRIEFSPDGAPFGWIFVLENKKNLSLISDSGELLISYESL